MRDAGLLRRAALLVALGLAGACSGADARSEAPAVAPPPAPRAPLAMRAALDTARLSQAFLRAADLPRLRSLLVQWRGELVRESYFGGANPRQRANIKSASKSVLSALVGIAVQQGHIRSTNQTIASLLPADTRGLDPVKRAITVGDLLSMRAGLQSTSFDNYGAWVSSRNWVRHALTRPMIAQPGGPMVYSTGSTHLLSAILTRATGMSTHQYAERALARPLGISIRPWQRDPQGIYFGGNDMYLTPRDMLRFGALYLAGGVANGRRIVSQAWIDSSWTERTTSPWNGFRYGYGWWTREAHGRKIRFAWGYGGQFIFVVPELQLVVVATSDPNASRYWGHTDALHDLLDREIMPAVGE